MLRHILIVDDEDNILNALERLLEEEGFVVYRSNSGKGGIEIMDQNPQIGVILSDQRMPEMSGTEFLREVKRKYSYVVRIILSGYSELSTITQAINEGAIFKFITKPWDENQLLNTVNEAFDYFELADKNRKLTQELQESNLKLAELNSALEKLVEEKTHNLKLHIASLRIYQEAMEYFPFGVLGVDSSGVIVLENQAARDIFSSHRTSLLGLPLSNAMDGIWTQACAQSEQFQKDESQVRLQIELNNTLITFFRLGREAKTVGHLIVVTTTF